MPWASSSGPLAPDAASTLLLASSTVTVIGRLTVEYQNEMLLVMPPSKRSASPSVDELSRYSVSAPYLLGALKKLPVPGRPGWSVSSSMKTKPLLMLTPGTAYTPGMPVGPSRSPVSKSSVKADARAGRPASARTSQRWGDDVGMQFS